MQCDRLTRVSNSSRHRIGSTVLAVVNDACGAARAGVRDHRPALRAMLSGLPAGMEKRRAWPNRETAGLPRLFFRTQSGEGVSVSTSED